MTVMTIEAENLDDVLVTATEAEFFRDCLKERIDALGLPRIDIPEMEVRDVPKKIKALADTNDGYHRVRMGRRKRDIKIGATVKQPLAVSYGLGTDSTALLILMAAQGVRPDVIMFADTGSEKPETYDYLEHMNRFLVSAGFPQVEVVRYTSKKYDSIADNCRKNRTLPSLAFGRKACSQKHKHDPMDVYDRNNRENYARAWAVGLKVRKLIGYDGSPADCRRSKIAEDAHYTYSYPLRDAGLVREDLYRIIDAAGLPQPGKSACYLCPAMKPDEIVQLAINHPALAADSLLIEANAERRTQLDRCHGSEWWQKNIDSLREKHPDLSDNDIAAKVEQYSTVGLGRKWSWRDLLQQLRPDLLHRLNAEYDTGQVVYEEALEERRRRGIPDRVPLNAADRIATVANLSTSSAVQHAEAKQKTG